MIYVIFVQIKTPLIKTIYILVFLCLCQQTAWANPPTKKYCDSIIKVGVEMLIRKEHVTSLELLAEAREIAVKKKWYKQSFLAQNNIGNNYYMLLDYGEALNYYLESYKIASAHLEDAQKMIVLNNIAILYSKEKKYDKANTHFSKAFDLAVKYKDSLKMGLYSMNMGILANEERKLNQAHALFRQSLQYSKTKEIAIPATVGLINTLLLSGNSKEARLKAQKLLKDLKKESNTDNRMDLNIIIAKSYLKEKQLANALQWTNASFADAPDLERKIELYELLADIYFQLHSYAVAFQYKDSLMSSRTQLNDIKNGKLFESNEVKFQVQNYKEKIIEKEARIKNERKLFISILIGIILAVVLLLFLFRSHFIKAKQKEAWAKREQQVTSFKLEKERAENALLIEKEKTTLLEQERLQNEIQLKNQRILSRALYNSGRNQLLQEIIDSFTQTPNFKDNEAWVKNTQALKQHIKMDDDWENYVRHFDEVNQGFIKRLTTKHPDLTTTDIRYLSYVYMNLDTKEIATLLHITPVACRKRKERIEKRLEFPHDMTLNTYLLNL